MAKSTYRGENQIFIVAVVAVARVLFRLCIASQLKRKLNRNDGAKTCETYTSVLFP